MKYFMVSFAFTIFCNASYSNNSKLKICLTGSTEKAIPKYGEAFINGAKLALSELKPSERLKVEYEVFYYESNPLAPVEKLNEMRKSNCDAIIGFSTGNDLLSIEEGLKLDPILTISIYGDPSATFSSTKYLRTMQPSADDLVNSLFEKLPFKIKENSKVLIITAIDRTEMVAYREAYLSHFKKITSNIQSIDVIEQTHDLSNLNNLLSQNNSWDYVVILARSLVAADASDLVHKKFMPIIFGTKYYGSSDLPAFYNFLKNKNVTAYFPRQNCSCDDSPEFLQFKKNYVKEFSVDPMSISADCYDATKFILKSLQLKQYNRKNIINFANSNNAAFLGISSFKVDKNFTTSSQKRFLIKVDHTGYSEVK